MRYNLALTSVEKDVLFRKYRQNGLSAWEAGRKIEGFSLYLNELVKRLVKQNKKPKQIRDKFQEEFEKMCMKLEV